MQAISQALKQNARHPAAWLAAITVMLVIATAFYVGPIAQDLDYHHFADQRTLVGIPHANDVLSNLPFCLFGLAGLTLAWRRRDRLDDGGNMYLGFFLGVLLTGFGSAYYHFAPSNPTLVWDRLPMTIGFMSLFALILAERVDSRLGRQWFPYLLLAGLASVLYWHLADDLRPYLLVQFGPMLVLPCLLLKNRRDGDRWLWLALGFYLLAKVLEAADGPVFGLTGEWISGHSLKHLAASVAPLMVLLKLRHETRARN